jgi:hypothetical protein
MTRLSLLLLACAVSAACGKKPAAKNPTPPPADQTEQKDGKKPEPTNTQRVGDPCDGGEKPKN